MRGKKREEKIEKKGKKREGRKKKTCEARWSKVGCDFLLLQAFQVRSKWNQGREAKEKKENK